MYFLYYLLDKVWDINKPILAQKMQFFQCMNAWDNSAV